MGSPGPNWKVDRGSFEVSLHHSLFNLTFSHSYSRDFSGRLFSERHKVSNEIDLPSHPGHPHCHKTPEAVSPT